jgi:hypothetical protein
MQQFFNAYFTIGIEHKKLSEGEFAKDNCR